MPSPLREQEAAARAARPLPRRRQWPAAGKARTARGNERGSPGLGEEIDVEDGLLAVVHGDDLGLGEMPGCRENETIPTLLELDLESPPGVRLPADLRLRNDERSLERL